MIDSSEGREEIALLSDIPKVPAAGDAAPLIAGTGSAGSSNNYSRSDHVHPAETTAVEGSVSVRGVQIVEGGFIPDSMIPVSIKNYNNLTNQPSINNVKLTGNKTATNLNLATSDQGKKADTAYQKPQGGIPSTDMTEAVRTSLGKADTSYQKPQGGIPSTDMTEAVRTSLGKADSAVQKSDIDRLASYAMPDTVIATSSSAISCANRSVINVAINASFSTLNLTFPSSENHKARDFYLRIVVAANIVAPSIAVPSGITIENPDGSIPVIADGDSSAVSTLVWFSETAPNIFTAKSETVMTVM